jgi:hypothetical protein
MPPQDQAPTRAGIGTSRACPLMPRPRRVERRRGASDNRDDESQYGIGAVAGLLGLLRRATGGAGSPSRALPPCRTEARAVELRQGKIRSCGCLRDEVRPSGHPRPPRVVVGRTRASPTASGGVSPRTRSSPVVSRHRVRSRRQAWDARLRRRERHSFGWSLRGRPRPSHRGRAATVFPLRRAHSDGAGNWRQ